MSDKLLELKEKCYDGDFDDNELIDLVLHLDRENKMLLEENINLEKENKQLKQALNEIREYSQDLRLYDNDSIEFKISTDILQIIDKVLGDKI